MPKFSERLGGEDKDSVFRMERDGAVTNWKCAIAVIVYLLSILGLVTCFVSFFFLFFHGIPLHSDAQYYDKTIVQNNACYLQNETMIVAKTKTAVAQYFEVSQDVTAPNVDPTYLPLKTVFCGRYLITYSADFTKNSTIPRPLVIEKLQKKFTKDKCIQMIDTNSTFSCFYNEKSTKLVDPRTTAKQTAIYRLMKVVSGLVGAGLLIICLPLAIISFIFIWKLNKKNYEDRGVKVFTLLFVSTITLQVVSASACILLPFLGWVLYPMGTYAGFLIFAVLLVIALVLPFVTILLSVVFRFCFRYHPRYFYVLLAISIALVVLGIVYQIALIYPLGVKGLQKLAQFNGFGN